MTYRGQYEDWGTMDSEERQEVLERCEFLDSEGCAIGYYVDNYLVGEVVDACSEYISFEWWMPVGWFSAVDDDFVTKFVGGRWIHSWDELYALEKKV